MAIMNYNKFVNILNKSIFEKSKSDLLIKISEKPERYIGLFRPTKPKAKILQNLLQSQEIRFGDALEEILEEYLKILGANILNKRFQYNGEELLLDQCFCLNNVIYFVEQKVRDDHDSTKKRGQINNFEKKLNVVLTNFKSNNVIGIMYFIDPGLAKNKSFYLSEINNMKEMYKIDLRVFYGEDFFNHLNNKDIWNEILEYLRKWKNQIHELPEINFDINSSQTFEEIKELPPKVFRKLFTNDEIFKEIILTIFPKKETLFLLLNHFENHPSGLKIYNSLYQILAEKLKEYS